MEEVNSSQREIILNHVDAKINLVIPQTGLQSEQTGITSSDDITFPIVTLEQFDRTELSIADPQKKRWYVMKYFILMSV